jgi:hypothetical protein
MTPQYKDLILSQFSNLSVKRNFIKIGFSGVDKSSNNQLFISFLAMLRNLYLNRSNEPTFYAVILAGLHDVKSLKAKIHPGEAQTLNLARATGTPRRIEPTRQSFRPPSVEYRLSPYFCP